MGDMTLPYLLRTKIIVLGVLAFSVIAFSPAVLAQSEQPASTSSDLYGASGQSSFQDAGAGYQQGSSGNDYTSSGSANVLNQVNNGTITVSGAPANSPTSEPSSNVKLWLSVIFFASGIGLLAMYIYTKRHQQVTAVAEQELAAEIIAEVEPKAKKAAAKADTKVEKSTKPAKKAKTKAKSKKKKHHR